MFINFIMFIYFSSLNRVLEPTVLMELTLTDGSIHSFEVQQKSLFKYMCCLAGKPTMWFPTRSDTNWPVQSQKRARSLKFRI